MNSVCHSCCRWIAGFGIFLVLLCMGVISQAGRFLEAPAETPSHADVIVALGGESGDRVLTAAGLFRDGFAPRLLVVGMDMNPAGVRPSYLNWRAQVLVEQGVPLERMIYDADSSNSWEEAVNTRRTMEANGWQHVLVVSDPYHMRRLQWTWGKVFKDSGLNLRWWRARRGGGMLTDGGLTRMLRWW